jgi:hypothetical protein
LHYVFFTAFKYDYEHKKLLKQCNCSCQESAINQRQKIDGIVATVGNYIVLDSDIDKSYLEISSQGGSIKDIRCQMLGKLLEDKLYAHQAIQDSVKVTAAEVKGLLETEVLHGGPNRFYGQSS